MNFNSMGNNMEDGAMPDEEVERIECPSCGRKFNEPALIKH
jgi:hypothetical protein